MTEARAYYEGLKDKFTLNLEESPAPGQIIYNKETHAYWTPKTCDMHNINFELFKAGELEARAEGVSAE